jgi:hypothetical protein
MSSFTSKNIFMLSLPFSKEELKESLLLLLLFTITSASIGSSCSNSSGIPFLKA